MNGKIRCILKMNDIKVSGLIEVYLMELLISLLGKDIVS